MSETKTSGIGGKVRANTGFAEKLVGLGEVKVIAVNPDRETYKELLGMDLKEDSKADEYLGESKDGNKTLRIDVWVELLKNKKRDKITYFLEDKKRSNKDETKKQYINTIGSCSWADEESNLPDWFKKRDYRQAYNGEEELYSFLQTWLGKLDLKDPDTILQIDFKKLMKGNVSDIRDQIDGEYAVTFLSAYTVKTVVKDEESKEYQSIYNKAFLPAYNLKFFRLVDYDKEEVVEGLRKKKSSDLKPHEKFVVNTSGEHGIKDAFLYKEIKEYNSEDFLTGSDEPIVSDDPSY